MNISHFVVLKPDELCHSQDHMHRIHHQSVCSADSTTLFK